MDRPRRSSPCARRDWLLAGSALALAAAGCVIEHRVVAYRVPPPPPPPPVADQADAAPPPGPRAASPPAASEVAAWPREYKEGETRLLLYQPQVESWTDDLLQARAAVEVRPREGHVVYGVVEIRARTDVDKAARVVTLRDVEIAGVRFPTEPDLETACLPTLRKIVPEGFKAIALDQIEASLAASREPKTSQGVPVKNDPPLIRFSAVPALLVLVDGPPAFRPVEGTGVERAINTRAFLAREGRACYARAARRWYRAAAPDGPWEPVAGAPPPVEKALEAAVAARQVDPLDPAPEAQPPAVPPVLYVSAVPAELLQTSGRPMLQPVEGTSLLHVKNSDSPIFMDVQTNEYYVLVSGRWFKSRSLENGPWAFVPWKSLPPDFAKIPSNHPRANVLASVPETPQAREAVIANAIPQTAAVKRDSVQLAVAYDGPPAFKPIEGTPLQYAVNTALPVIRVDEKSYYCVSNGVWFAATSPEGPWAAASDVPAVLYTIPTSSPLHYVTYVRIYGSTESVVYTGYTPGYLGTVVCPDGVVVYGTGYWYPCYIGRVWYGWPYTYGFGAGFGCDLETGFTFGFAAGAYWGVWCHPWWGPYGWGWYHGYHYMHCSMDHVNIYHNHWSVRSIAVHGPGPVTPYSYSRVSREAGRPFNPYVAKPRTPPPAPARAAEVHGGPRGISAGARRGNNVLAGRDGHVYRPSAGGAWERHSPSGWTRVDPGSHRYDLERQQSARGVGGQRVEGLRSSPGGGRAGAPGGGGHGHH